jgi:LysM repeat protein
MTRNWLAMRAWLLVMILVTSLAGSPAIAQGAATVHVEAAALTVQVNDTFNVSVKVDNIANLSAFELHLAFSPGVLEVTGLTNGGFVTADFTVQNTFDNAAGTIDYAVAQMNRPSAQGNGTLLNISFRAKANGSSTLTTRDIPATPGGLLLVDQNGVAIQVAWAPGMINVGTPEQTATVTPASSPTLTTTPTQTITKTPTINAPAPTSTPTTITNPPTSTSTAVSMPTRTSTPVTPTPSPSGIPGTHVVRFGEWIYCIGRAYRVSPWAIVEANHIWWPYIIFPNQKLTIPNAPWVNMTAGPICKAQFTMPTPTPVPTATAVTPIPPTATPIPATTAPPPACRATYVVRHGDTLYSIALRYGTAYTEIARANGISNPRLIYPGQQLCIP